MAQAPVEDDDSDEETKAPLQEGIDPVQWQMEKQRKKEAKEFRELLQELVYSSSHPKNEWKRKEVAILMINTFIKDVSAYLIRNPVYDQL